MVALSLCHYFCFWAISHTMGHNIENISIIIFIPQLYKNRLIFFLKTADCALPALGNRIKFVVGCMCIICTAWSFHNVTPNERLPTQMRFLKLLKWMCNVYNLHRAASCCPCERKRCHVIVRCDVRACWWSRRKRCRRANFLQELNVVLRRWESVNWSIVE